MFTDGPKNRSYCHLSGAFMGRSDKGLIFSRTNDQIQCFNVLMEESIDQHIAGFLPEMSVLFSL